MEVREQFSEVNSHPSSPLGPGESLSGCHAYQQEPLPAESSHQPLPMQLVWPQAELEIKHGEAPMLQSLPGYGCSDLLQPVNIPCPLLSTVLEHQTQASLPCCFMSPFPIT